MRVYVLSIFGILAGRCGSVVVNERYWGPSTTLGCDVLFSFNRNTLNGTDGLRKGNPRRALFCSCADQLQVEVREIRGLWTI